MATKTSSKTTTGKPASKAFGGGRKTAAAQKPAAVAPKTNLPKSNLKTKVAPEDAAAGVKQRAIRSETSESKVPTQPSPHQETVSLIDRKRPAKKPKDGEIKTKRAILPPISRIRASLETPSKPAPPTPAQAPLPSVPSVEPAETAASKIASPSPEVEAGPQQKVLLIKPPIVVKQFATELGLKPHQLIAELM